MARLADETNQQWHQRAQQELRVLQVAEKEHWHRLGFDRTSDSGEPWPTIDDEFRTAIDRARHAELGLRAAAAAAMGESNDVSRVLDHARVHLADHDLTSRTTAEALDISVRHLNKVCADAGIQFDPWVTAQRLEATRRELATPAGRRRAVFAVAWAWGFSDPRHFSRRFRLAYGVSPAQWQANPDVARDFAHSE